MWAVPDAQARVHRLGLSVKTAAFPCTIPVAHTSCARRPGSPAGVPKRHLPGQAFAARVQALPCWHLLRRQQDGCPDKVPAWALWHQAVLGLPKRLPDVPHQRECCLTIALPLQVSETRLEVCCLVCAPTWHGSPAGHPRDLLRALPLPVRDKHLCPGFLPMCRLFRPPTAPPPASAAPQASGRAASPARGCAGLPQSVCRESSSRWAANQLRPRAPAPVPTANRTSTACHILSPVPIPQPILLASCCS